MKNGQIFKYHQDILSMQGTVMEYWFEGYIKVFYKKYGMRLQNLNKRLEALSAEYFQISDGKMLYDSNRQPLPKEGANVEEYKAKFTAIMSEESNLIAVR